MPPDMVSQWERMLYLWRWGLWAFSLRRFNSGRRCRGNSCNILSFPLTHHFLQLGLMRKNTTKWSAADSESSSRASVGFQRTEWHKFSISRSQEVVQMFDKWKPLQAQNVQVKQQLWSHVDLLLLCSTLHWINVNAVQLTMNNSYLLKVCAEFVQLL